MAVEPRRIINGTFGEVWRNGEYVMNLYGMQAKVSYEKSTIKQCGRMMSGKKLVGAEGTGSIKTYKIDSSQAKLLRTMQDGKTPEISIISKLADPDSFGAERIMYTGVIFDDNTLADFEAGVEGKQELPFTFDGYEFLDMIEAEE